MMAMVLQTLSFCHFYFETNERLSEGLISLHIAAVSFFCLSRFVHPCSLLASWDGHEISSQYSHAASFRL